MKQKFLFIRISITIFLISYLVGAFIEWNINPGEWEKNLRLAVALCTSFISMLYKLIIYPFIEDVKNVNAKRYN